MITTHFEPGNMTRYTISQSKLTGEPEGDYNVFIWWDRPGGGAAMRIPAGDDAVTPGHVGEKMDVNEADAVCLAYFITSALGGEVLDFHIPWCIKEKRDD